LAVELTVVVLLISGGCYSKQDYHVLSPAAGDELLSTCNVVVEGRIVNVGERILRKWTDYIFFCWSLDETPTGPKRYVVYLDIETILKGDPKMPRRLEVDNCRPLTSEEQVLFAQASEGIPIDVRVRIGFNRQRGNSFRNLIVVPLEPPPAPTTQPAPATQPQRPRIPMPPGVRRAQ